MVILRKQLEVIILRAAKLHIDRKLEDKDLDDIRILAKAVAKIMDEDGLCIVPASKETALMVVVTDAETTEGTN